MFAVMAIVVISSTLLNYWLGVRLVQLRAATASHRKVITESQRVLATLEDAETSQRGFIITSDEKYLAGYNAARVRLDRALERLRKLKQIYRSPKMFGTIAELSQAKLRELERTISQRRTSGFGAAAALVRGGEGKDTTLRLHEHIDRLQDRQELDLQTETRFVGDMIRARTLAVVAAGLINLFFVVWAYRRLTALSKAREEALRTAEGERIEVQRQKDLLTVTLASIGDCVIVTDSARRITFMNPVAERVTGWSFEEARLRPTAEIFRIFNEFSHELVESPVEKAMKHGAIVGLANHTLLIRKDGTELSIDARAAPIREVDGTTRGVVLVFCDFTEHNEAQSKLKEAKDTAEKANKAKDQFLAMLSHELRTPLTPVLATLNLWETSNDLPPSMNVDVQMLRRSVELEARIIDDLLDLTRIAKGMLSFSPEDTDVHELLQFLVVMCRTEFCGKELSLRMRLNARRHYVHTDAGRLQQILWNIIKNAAKFTNSGGRVNILTRNNNGDIAIAVADTGIGMADETLARLFIPFEQGEQLVSRRYGGLGLGMAISSAMVSLLGGKLSAKSGGLGKGSTFTVTFPATDGTPVGQRSAGIEPRNRSRKGAKILLVEDHDDTARTLARLLQSQGYEVKTAGLVASALEALRREAFDLLLCDIGLPDGTGFQLIEEVRKDWRTPALALSGFGMEEDVAKSKAAGFEGHLTKPVNFQKLEAAIRQLTASA